MTVTVNGPNGVTVNFPDGTAPDTINAVMAHATGLSAPKSDAPKADTPYGMGDVGMAALRGVPIAGGLIERFSSPESQDQYKQFDENHPWVSGGAKAVGGIASMALPLGLPGKAGQLAAKGLGLTGATLGRQVANSAISGGVLSAADAVARGTDIKDQAEIGSALGAAAPLVGRGIGALAAPVVNTLQGIRNPAGVAGRAVGTAISRDIRAGNAGMSDAEIQAAQSAGLPVTNMERGGELTRGLARSAANTSPEGRAALDNTINTRFEGQAERLNKFLDDQHNFPNAHAQQKAIDASVTNEVNPAYKAAFSDSARRNPNGLWDEGFEQMLQSPHVQDAVRKAVIMGQESAAREGFTPVKGLFASDASGRMTRSADAARNGFAPTLEFWNEVKKNLDKVGSFEARDWSRVLRTRLDDLVPSYGNARAARFSLFQSENALEAGQKFVSQKFNNAEVRDAVTKMTGQEKQLFQDGYVSRLKETINSVGDRRSVLNRIANSPTEREKAVIALGPEKAKQLFDRLRQEGVMDKARPAVQGNSTTARQLTELGLAGGAYGLGTGLDLSNPNPSALASAALVYGAAKGRGAINQNVARHVAELLASQNRIPTLGAPGFLRTLGNPDIGGAQVGSVLASRALPRAF